MSLVKIDSFNEQRDQLKKFLPEYLKEMGHDVTNGRKILCLNPEHDDNSPSMSVFEGQDGVPICHCFSCGYNLDIFTAAHVLEHKPMIGPGFVQDNVMYLANKYGVDIETRSLTEDEIYEMNTYDAYKLAAQYISKAEFGKLQLDELAKREWDEKFVRKRLVGTCDDFNKMRSLLKMSGFSAKFLDEIDLGNSRIFSPNNLIFTVIY